MSTHYANALPAQTLTLLIHSMEFQHGNYLSVERLMAQVKQSFPDLLKLRPRRHLNLCKRECGRKKK